MRALIFHALAIALAMWLGVGTAVAITPEDAVQTLAADLDTALTAPDPAAAVEAVLSDRFAVTAMALAALPDDLRPDASTAYVTAYRGYLARTLVTRSLGAGEGGVVPLGHRTAGALTLVGANIYEDGRIVRMVEFYLQPRGDGFTVNNIAVEGLLATAQNRKDFAPVLAQGGLPALIDWLEAQR